MYQLRCTTILGIIKIALMLYKINSFVIRLTDCVITLKA
jgi:hypothetical protein